MPFLKEGIMVKKSGNQTFVVQSKVRELIRKSKLKCSSDVIGQLNHIITYHVGRGCERAKSNGRKTLRATDL